MFLSVLSCVNLSFLPSATNTATRGFGSKLKAILVYKINGALDRFSGYSTNWVTAIAVIERGSAIVIPTISSKYITGKSIVYGNTGVTLLSAFLAAPYLFIVEIVGVCDMNGTRPLAFTNNMTMGGRGNNISCKNMMFIANPRNMTHVNTSDWKNKYDVPVTTMMNMVPMALTLGGNAVLLLKVFGNTFTRVGAITGVKAKIISITNAVTGNTKKISNVSPNNINIPSVSPNMTLSTNEPIISTNTIPSKTIGSSFTKLSLVKDMKEKTSSTLNTVMGPGKKLFDLSLSSNINPSKIVVPINVSTISLSKFNPLPDTASILSKTPSVFSTNSKFSLNPEISSIGKNLSANDFASHLKNIPGSKIGNQFLKSSVGVKGKYLLNRGLQLKGKLMKLKNGKYSGMIFTQTAMLLALNFPHVGLMLFSKNKKIYDRVSNRLKSAEGFVNLLKYSNPMVGVYINIFGDPTIKGALKRYLRFISTYLKLFYAKTFKHKNPIPT
ncbi:unnamed protein product [Gordionus sp. m RMFG-2023]